MKRCHPPVMHPPLQPGDCLGIVAPASHIPRGNEDFLHRGAARLREMGFEIRYSSFLLQRRHLYLAGTDEERAQELMEMFLDPGIKAILCTRGGYGAQRIIPYLDPDVMRSHPKALVGCSDITVLLIYLLQRCLVIPLHGPNVATRQFVEGDTEIAQSLHEALTASAQVEKITCSVLREGEAQGEIIGGCLSSLVTTVGTPYEPDLQGKVLFVEDVDEPPYRIDRMLTHLKSAGKLAGVRGVVFGQMPGCDTEKGLLHKVILDVLKEIEGPVLFGFPSGHGPRNLTFPLGTWVRIQGGVMSFHGEGEHGP